MGTVVSGFNDKNENDPNNVMVAPNLGGFNRVIVSLPNGLQINDVLTDLVENGYLNGVEEHDKAEEEHFVIKRENEKQVNILISHINSKFGYIAQKGYVKPSRNIIINKNYNNKCCATTTDIARSSHIALIQSPIGKNPNQQFSAFRREFDPESEFPKFERVDIEETIHYTRPEEGVNSLKNKNKNNFDMGSHAKYALDAMTTGIEFDITETLIVKDREAVKVDYIEKARKLRIELKNSKLRKMKNAKYQKKICQQFKYDHMNNLIQLKQKKYGINRTKRIYGMQRAQRLKMAEMKQIIDPNTKPTEYDKQQTKFWENFDFFTK